MEENQQIENKPTIKKRIEDFHSIHSLMCVFVVIVTFIVGFGSFLLHGSYVSGFMRVIVIILLVIGCILALFALLLIYACIASRLEMRKGLEEDVEAREELKAYRIKTMKQLIVIILLIAMAITLVVAFRSCGEKERGGDGVETCRFCGRKEKLVVGFGMCLSCWEDFNERQKDAYKD